MRKCLPISISLLLYFLAFIICAVAFADAQTLRKCPVVLASHTSHTTASTTDDVQKFIAQNYKSLSFVADANNTAGTNPTLDITVEDCVAEAGPCKTLVAFDQCTTGECWTAGYQIATMNPDTSSWFPYFRAKAVIGGTATPTYNYTVSLCADITK